MNFPFNINDVAQAVDALPNMYNRVGEVIDFVSLPQAETTVTLIRRDGQIVLLDPVSRDAPRQEMNGEEETSLSFVVPSRKIGDTLTPSDIQNITRFAPGPRQLEQMNAAYARKLQRLRKPHDITFEHIRIGAMKGVITKPNGDVMYDLFNEFGVSKKVLTVDLTDPNLKILDVTKEINDHIGENLHGETSNGTHVFVGSDALNLIRQLPSYEKYLDGHAAALEQLAASRHSPSDPNNRRSVLIDGVMFESYSGKAKNSAGDTVKFIDDNRGHAFPTGTMEMFADVDVPANRTGSVNVAPSEEIKIYPKELDQEKGFDLDTESNKIAYCARPEALVELQLTIT